MIKQLHVDTCRFMPSKLSNLVDNLSEINNKDCKTCIERKNIKSECGFVGLKNNRLNYRCKECNGTSAKSKFVLLLRKGVYPYEYMDSWERFNETSLPPKKDFYSELILEDISERLKTMHTLKECLMNIAQTWMIIMICMFKLIHFCLQMSLKNLETNALKYTDLILLIFILHLD